MIGRARVRESIMVRFFALAALTALAITATAPALTTAAPAADIKKATVTAKAKVTTTRVSPSSSPRDPCRGSRTSARRYAALGCGR